MLVFGQSWRRTHINHQHAVDFFQSLHLRFSSWEILAENTVQLRIRIRLVSIIFASARFLASPGGEHTKSTLLSEHAFCVCPSFLLFFFYYSLYSKPFKIKDFRLLYTVKFVQFKLVFRFFYPSQSQFQFPI